MQDEHHHLRRLQGGGGGGPDDHDREHAAHWDPTENTVGVDSLGNFWLRENVMFGGEAGDQFGYSVAADYNNVVVRNQWQRCVTF